VAVNRRPQACVVLLVQEHAERRLGTRDRLFRNGYTVLLAGTLAGTRNLLADIMPASAVVDMGSNVDRAVELRAQLEQDPRFRGIPVMLELDLE
jgi:response regulator RpfG family c-di-GMP phosphodiesterase